MSAVSGDVASGSFSVQKAVPVELNNSWLFMAQNVGAKYEAATESVSITTTEPKASATSVALGGVNGVYGGQGGTAYGMYNSPNFLSFIGTGYPKRDNYSNHALASRRFVYTMPETVFPATTLVSAIDDALYMHNGIKDDGITSDITKIELPDASEVLSLCAFSRTKGLITYSVVLACAETTGGLHKVYLVYERKNSGESWVVSSTDHFQLNFNTVDHPQFGIQCSVSAAGDRLVVASFDRLYLFAASFSLAETSVPDWNWNLQHTVELSTALRSVRVSYDGTLLLYTRNGVSGIVATLFDRPHLDGAHELVLNPSGGVGTSGVAADEPADASDDVSGLELEGRGWGVCKVAEDRYAVMAEPAYPYKILPDDFASKPIINGVKGTSVYWWILSTK